MERKFPIKAGLLASLLLLPWTADAAGLGKLTVTSALGQPLRGEIELLVADKSELASITARIASYEAFKQANIERNPALSNVRFTVEQKPSGESYIKVTSSQPINEPFLDMLIQVDWAAGRLVREYTVLLDPPGYEAAAAAPVSAPEAAPAAAPAPEKKPEEMRAAIPLDDKLLAEAKPAAKKAAPAKEAAPAETYAVKKGDTLGKIAGEVKPEGVSLDQMLVAMFHANKQAFAGANMNRLKTGQILRVPETQHVTAVSQAEAAKEVKLHAADWNAYRQKLAGAVAAAKPEKEEAAPRAAAGKISAAVEEKAPAPKEAPKDVLKLSKGEAAAKPGKEAQALQERVHALQEEATAREKAVQEANQRIAALEKNIKEMQRLVELKNQSLAALQKQAAETKGAPSAAAQPAPAPAPEEKPAVAETPAPAPAEKPAAAPTPAPAEKPAAVPAPKAPAPAPAEPSLLDEILATPAYLGGLLGALVLAVLVGMRAMAGKRKKKAAAFEQSVTTGGDLKARTVMGRPTGGPVETGDTSFLTDFSQAGLGSIDTGEVDPIAEAEVYMAYGRDVQAEEILKEAMAKDPSRQEVRIKLLEIYAARKNLRAFESLASELYATLGGESSPAWDKVAEMGRAIDPTNPLYGGAPQASADFGKTMVLSAGVAGAAAAAALAAPEGREEIVEAAPELDLDLGVLAGGEAAEFAAPEAAVEEAPEELGAGLDFNLAFGAPAEAEAPAAAEPEAPAAEEAVVDFDFGLTAPEQPAGAEAGEAAPEAEELISADSWKEAVMQLDTGEPTELEKEFATMEELGLPEESAAAPAVAEMPEAPAEEALNFEFTMAPEEAVPMAEAPAAVPELDLSGISLELETPPEAAPAAPEEPVDLALEQEVATKLDLAKAYIEMGDKEGAREILEEVAKDGSPVQQEEAGKLMADLG